MSALACMTRGIERDCAGSDVQRLTPRQCCIAGDRSTQSDAATGAVAVNSHGWRTATDEGAVRPREECGDIGAIRRAGLRCAPVRRCCVVALVDAWVCIAAATSSASIESQTDGSGTVRIRRSARPRRGGQRIDRRRRQKRSARRQPLVACTWRASVGRRVSAAIRSAGWRNERRKVKQKRRIRARSRKVSRRSAEQASCSSIASPAAVTQHLTHRAQPTSDAQRGPAPRSCDKTETTRVGSNSWGGSCEESKSGEGQ